jgi:tripartite-type tricarboxylate transporter receptor subunit TctC
MRRRALLLGPAILRAGAGPAAAQAPTEPPWPAARPIRLLVGFPAGGSVDLLARVLAEKLSAALGQAILVENRPGQAATLATETGARAAPDGYTLLMANIGTMAINPHIYRAYPVDTLRDVQPLSRLVTYQLFFFVPAELAARTLPEFIELARPRPGQWNFASAGAGGIVHVAGELFNRTAGLSLVHVPYRGTVQSMADLATGRVQLQIDIWGAGEAFLNQGRLRALATSGPERTPLAPDVPTAREQGVDYVLTGWQAMVAPAGTPRPVVDRLNAEIKRALADPEVARRLRAQGNEPAPSTPGELRELIAADRARMGQVVREAGIAVD